MDFIKKMIRVFGFRINNNVKEIKHVKRIILIAALLFTGIYNTACSYNFTQEEKININIYEKINPSIVAIEVRLVEGFSAGTGCIVRSDGVILTGSHVIDGAESIEVKTSNGKIYNAKIAAVMGKNKDLALLKLETKEKFPVITFGNSDEVKVGQRVLAIGNPFGFAGTLTQGIVSRIDYAKDRIQTDASINPGCSGGPLLNASGEVIGISQSIYNPDNNISNIGIGFAIPVNEAKKFIASADIDEKPVKNSVTH